MIIIIIIILKDSLLLFPCLMKYLFFHHSNSDLYWFCRVFLYSVLISIYSLGYRTKKNSYTRTRPQKVDGKWLAKTKKNDSVRFWTVPYRFQSVYLHCHLLVSCASTQVWSMESIVWIDQYRYSSFRKKIARNSIKTVTITTFYKPASEKYYHFFPNHLQCVTHTQIHKQQIYKLASKCDGIAMTKSNKPIASSFVSFDWEEVGEQYLSIMYYYYYMFSTYLFMCLFQFSLLYFCAYCHLCLPRNAQKQEERGQQENDQTK